MALWPGIPQETSELAQKVVQANKDHQYALKVYTERLEAELEAVDKLLTTAEQSDEEPDVDAGGNAVVPESIKPVGPFPPDASLEDSPFWPEAERRQRYLKHTVIHPMKMSELEALSEAVKAEIQRAHVHESRQLGQQTPTSDFGGEIDWNRVAARVSSSGSADVQRSEGECEIRWRGSASSQWNHNVWAQAELARLRELVGNAKEGEVDWVDVSHKLGTGRMPIDCMRHAITRRTHLWTPEADRCLVEAVRVYGTANWMLIARTVSDDATASQCQSRYTRSLDPSLVRGAWTEEQDAQLSRAVEVYGRSWSDVCNYVAGRSSEQCRDRWQDFLDPIVTRSNWTETEDQVLLNAVEQVGEGRWKEISRFMNSSRTDSMCRSRYATLMKRKLKTASTSMSPTPSDTAAIPSQVATPTPSSSGQLTPFEDETAMDFGKISLPRFIKSKRGKAAVSHDDSVTNTKETARRAAAPAKPALRQHKFRLATSSTAKEPPADVVGEKDLTIDQTKDQTQHAKKRAAQTSPQKPPAKKRKGTKSDKSTEPTSKTAEMQDRDRSTSDTFTPTKHSRPRPRTVSTKNAAGSPTSAMSDTTATDTAARIPDENTSSASHEGHMSRQASTASTRPLSPNKSKSVGVRRRPPAAVPARKSARLANRSGGGPADNTDREFAKELTSSVGQDKDNENGDDVAVSDRSSVLSSLPGSPQRK